MIELMNGMKIAEELDEHARIELLHRMRSYLAQFCKLVVYNVIPTKAAADVFKYYVKVRKSISQLN